MRKISGCFAVLISICVQLAQAQVAGPGAMSLPSAAEKSFNAAVDKGKSLSSSISSVAKRLTPSSLGGIIPQEIQTAEPTGRSAGKLVYEMNLAAVLNKHLKTSFQYSLSGAQVWLSGSFDQPPKDASGHYPTPNAYIAVLEDGKAPRYSDLKWLIKHDQSMKLGSGSYTLSLDLNYTEQLKSNILLTNDANATDQRKAALGDVMMAIYAVGDAVTIGSQSYRVFYYDNANATTRSFLFFFLDAKGEYKLFTTPAEIVPTDGAPAVIKMYDSQPIGLLQINGKLQIFDCRQSR